MDPIQTYDIWTVESSHDATDLEPEKLGKSWESLKIQWLRYHHFPHYSRMMASLAGNTPTYVWRVVSVEHIHWFI